MAGNPGKKPHVELRRPPPNADSFVNQGAAVPSVYASFPVAPPVAAPVVPPVPAAPEPVPAAPPSVPASVPAASEVRKASPAVVQEDEEADLEADEDDEELSKPSVLQRLAAASGTSEDELGALLSRGSPAEPEAEPTAIVQVSSKGRLSRKSKGNSKAVVQRVSGRQLRRTTIYFDVELARTLAVYCASTDREMSEVVSLAVKQFLKKNPL